MRKLLLYISLFICSQIGLAQEALVAYYPFNGNADDESGNGNNGAVTRAALAADRFGNPISAYYFGGDDYIKVVGNQAFNMDESGFTVSFWMKPDQVQPKSWATLIGFGDYAHGGYKVLYNKSHSAYVGTFFYNHRGNETSIRKDELNMDIWCMYSFAFKEGVLKHYLNGVYQGSIDASDYPANEGTDLLIGEGFAGSIDDIKIYDRALSDLEIAELSGLSGAVRATELDAYSLADFELGILEPIKHSAYWDVWGNHAKAYSEVVGNPVKSGSNTSEYVGVSVTFPSSMEIGSDCQKSEFVITSERGLADEHHHIMKWTLLLTDSSLLKLDTIVWDWMYFNQIHTGCGKYPHGNHDPEPSIAYGGGIFNDCKIVSGKDPSEFCFRYRAMPDSASVPFKIDIGKWMSFTYEIFWTHSDNGYWRVWKDGVLLASANQVKTLPDACDEDANFLHFKTGLYNRWNDPEIDSLSLYFDDIELYIGDDISVEEVSPECGRQHAFEYKNPISNGIDEKGLRDCQVLREGDWWYLTGTSYPHWPQQESDGNLNKGVVLYKSKDLLNWEFVDYIVKRPTIDKWYFGRFWAPEIHKIGNKYYALFNCWNSTFENKKLHSGYAVSDDIEGPYTVLTEDKPLCEGNDLTFFEDDDGKVWAFWNASREFGIGYAQIDLGTATFLTEPRSAIQAAEVDYEYNDQGELVYVFDNYLQPKVTKYYDWDAVGIEGAYVIKNNGIYYLFYSSWTRGYEIGYATAKEITGPWEKHPDNPFYGAMSKETCRKNGFEWRGDEDNPFVEAGHNEVFRGPDGQFWLSCHGIRDDGVPLLLIDPIWFDVDGNLHSDGPTYTKQMVKL